MSKIINTAYQRKIEAINYDEDGGWLAISDSATSEYVAASLDKEDREALIRALGGEVKGDKPVEVGPFMSDADFIDVQVGDRVRRTIVRSDGSVQTTEGAVLRIRGGVAWTAVATILARVEDDEDERVTLDILGRPVPRPTTDWARDCSGVVWHKHSDECWRRAEYNPYAEDFLTSSQLEKYRGPLTYMELSEVEA